MALRFVLVSLVAGLGVEWPSGAELARMASGGRAWLASQWDGLSATLAGLATSEGEESGAEGAPAGASTTAREPAFARAAGERVASGTIEVVEEEAIAATVDRPEDARFEAVVEAMASAFVSEAAGEVPVDPIDPGLAMNLIYDGIDDEGMSPAPPSADLAARPAVGHDPAPAPTPEPPGGADRLGTALRLTGQAFQAWVSVLQHSTPETVAHR